MFTFSEFIKRKISENVNEIDELPNYVKNGKVFGYHFLSPTKNPKKEITLDPSKFGSSQFSQSEVRSASYPRIFFYVDLNDKESFFGQDNPLYKAEMPVREIYSIPSDPLGIVNDLSKKGHQMGKVLNFLHEYGYNGVYYQTPNMKILNWFEPISAKLVQEESKEYDRIEKNKQFNYDLSGHNLESLKSHMDDFNLRHKSGGLTYGEMMKKLELQDKWDMETPERLKQRAERRAKGLW